MNPPPQGRVLDWQLDFIHVLCIHISPRAPPSSSVLCPLLGVPNFLLGQMAVWVWVSSSEPSSGHPLQLPLVAGDPVIAECRQLHPGLGQVWGHGAHRTGQRLRG